MYDDNDLTPCESDPYNHMADEHSGAYEDEYDRYEDYVTETGNDPYHLFDDESPLTRVQWLLNDIYHWTRKLMAFWRWLTHTEGSSNSDDIPF